MGSEASDTRKTFPHKRVLYVQWHAKVNVIVDLRTKVTVVKSLSMSDQPLPACTIKETLLNTEVDLWASY